MNRLANLLSRARWPLLVAPIMLSVFLLRVSDSSTEAIIIWGLVLVIMLVVVAIISLNLAGFDPAVDERVTNLTADPVSAELLKRWLSRSKHFRFVGGAAGFVLGVGWMGGNLLTLLLSVLGGVAVGGAAAELHSLRRQKTKAKSANVVARKLGDYVERGDAVAMAAAVVIAVLFAILSMTSSNVGSGFATLASAGALLVVAITFAMQWMVVVRPRPALPLGLRKADDLMRHLAVSLGFTRPAIALSFGLLAASLEWFGSDGLSALVALALWGAALGWYIASRQSTKNLLRAVRS